MIHVAHVEVMELKGANVNIKTGSDFSGVGAFDQALKRLGITQDKLFACDQDKYARQSYIENYGEPDYYPEDVYNREIPDQSLDIYMTSPPCQAFSLAGKRKGEDDERGILFYNSHEFIKINNPRFFIFENVKGLLSHDKRNKKSIYGNTFSKWIELLGGKSVNGNPTLFPDKDSVPYHIYWKVLNATDFDIPQNRERVFIIGIRDDSDNSFSWPKPLKSNRKLKDVLEHEVDAKYFLSEKMLKGFINATERNKEKGSGFKFEPSDTQGGQVYSEEGKSPTLSAGTHGYANGYVKCFPVLTPKRLEKRQNGRRFKEEGDPSFTLTTQDQHGVLIQKEYTKGNSQGNRVYDPNGVSSCLCAEGGGKGAKTGLYEIESKIRRLTPRECFRLMDFPESYKIVVSDTQAYKQAGNSIAVGVLAAVINKLPL